ncbi:hypothetical protein BC628DRAFT_1416032 [Trametes gibbosa]|nr:hypothetical protein BC628DRAFT_1416032 [Trametes gibbosa]
MLSALRRISSAAHTKAAKFEPHVLPPSRGTFDPLPELVLPIPSPLTPRLIALGIHELAAQRISVAVIESIKLLKRSCEEGFQQCRDLLQAHPRYIPDRAHLLSASAGRLSVVPASKVPAAYLKLYLHTIEQWTTYLVEQIAPRILTAQDRAGRSQFCSHFHKRPFNQSAIPVLEKFFDNNAFPSRLEKVELASECQMDYRQIHVWFQNRRSRFRKEGKLLNRRSDDAVGFEKLEDTIMKAFLPETGVDDEADLDFTAGERSSKKECKPGAPSNHTAAYAQASARRFQSLDDACTLVVSNKVNFNLLPNVGNK